MARTEGKKYAEEKQQEKEKELAYVSVPAKPPCAKTGRRPDLLYEIAQDVF